MRYIIVMLFFISSLYARNFAIVFVDNHTIKYNNSLTSNIESLFKEQSIYFEGKNSVNIVIDKNQKIKKIYTREGVSKLIRFAKKKKYDSIAFVEYKRATRYLSIVVIRVDEKVQDKKSQSIAFSSSIIEELPSTVLNHVLSLNYELGILNGKIVY